MSTIMNMIKVNDIILPAIVSLVVSMAGLAFSLMANIKLNERNYEVEYVTKEREKWRKDIKEKTSLFCSICSMNNAGSEEKKLRKLKTFIILSLNPKINKEKVKSKNATKSQEISEEDEYNVDQDIIHCLNIILSDAINNKNIQRRKRNIRELEKLVAFLLKDEWESVKKDMDIAYRKVNREKRIIGKKEEKALYQEMSVQIIVFLIIVVIAFLICGSNSYYNSYKENFKQVTWLELADGEVSGNTKVEMTGVVDKEINGEILVKSDDSDDIYYIKNNDSLPIEVNDVIVVWGIYVGDKSNTGSPIIDAELIKIIK